MRRSMNALLQRCSGLHSIVLISAFLGLHGYFQANPATRATSHLSLKALGSHIRELRSRVSENEASARDAILNHEGESGLDYLDALYDYLSVRAYPYDEVDWDALRQAVAQRDANLPPRIFSTATWQFLGPQNCASPGQWAFGPARVSGRVGGAAFDPTNPLVMYLASSGGGAWKTLDGGTTWAPMGDGWSNLPTSCVVVDPHNANNIFVGTGDWDGWGGYGQGIMRSTDGGVSWNAVGSAQFGNFAIRRILVDPDDGQIVTAVAGRGAGGNGKVWRSTDGGLTWTAVVATGAYWCDIEVGAPDNLGNRAYYACAGGTAAQVWISSDRGATWTKLTTPLRQNVSQYDTADLACSQVNPGTVYLLGTGDHKVWKSTNFGGSWTDISTATLTSANWGQAWYDFYITCSKNAVNDVLYVGLIDILQSWDGVTWRSFMNGYTGNDKAHVDEHNFIIDPTNPSHALACNDGGIYSVSVDSNGVGTFTGLNTSLGITEFYHADFHPTDPLRVIGGAQDNGSPADLGVFGTWRSVTGGDGGACLINQTTPNTQYTTYQYFGGNSGGTSPNNIGFNRTTNNWGGSSWVQTNVYPDRVAWMGPFEMAANSSSTIYVGTNYLWRYVDTTNSWTARLGNQALSATSTVRCIGVTKADANVIYTGSGDGQLWVTRNGGSNWTQINSGSVSLPNRAFMAVSCRDDTANDVLVGVSGTGTGHVWRCMDTSAGSRTWIDVSGSGNTGLPNIPVNALARDPVDPVGTWYAGTDIGVYKTSDAGATWQNITQPLGLPNVEISTLRVRNGYLYAATYGRGMWRLLVNDPSSGLTVSSLTLSPDTVVGSAPSTGTVTLSGPAPAGGVTVGLSSSDTLAATVPTTANVPEGMTSAQFLISTTAVATQHISIITATLNGTATANLTVNPTGLTSLVLNPDSVVGGNPSQASITVGTPAPAGGMLVQLSSSNTAVATVPSTVTIPAGQTSANFTVTTVATPNDATSTIKAVVGASSVQAQLTVNAPSIQTLSLAAPSVVGGSTVQGTITLNGRAPNGGLAVAVTSSDTNVATVPATVTVPSGTTSVNFTVTAKVVLNDTGVTITASFHGLQRYADLLVVAQKITSVAVTPNPVVGGNTAQGKVILAGPATGSVVVQLSSQNPNAATVPASVTVPSGASSATFTVTSKQVASVSSSLIIATYGSSTKQTTLEVSPLLLAGFSLSANQTFEGSTITGLVTLNGPALSGGAVVQLTNSNSLAANVPTSVTVPQGAVSKSFTFTTARVTSPQQTTITAKRGAISISQLLAVAPITIQSVQLASSTVTGGINVSGVVRIVAAAPSGGYAVNLSSSYTNAATVPTTVTIPQGGTSIAFTVTTKPVPQTYFVTITASHNSSTAQTQLQVLPPEVSSFRLSTTSTRGGNNVTGTVTLTGKAPPNGMTVHIAANPALAYPTATVVVPAGYTSKSFTIATQHVTVSTPVTMSAWTLTIVKYATITLTP